MPSFTALFFQVYKYLMKEPNTKEMDVVVDSWYDAQVYYKWHLNQKENTK